MKRPLLALGLTLAATTLGGAFPEGEYAKIILKKRTHAFHDSLALYSPQPAEKSRSEGPEDLPVLAIYFFRPHLTPEQKTSFIAAIVGNRRGTGPEYPYAVLELGIRPEPPLRPGSVHVFTVGRCVNEKDFHETGAMLDYPDQEAQWKVEFSNLSGELKDGARLEFDVSLEHKASHYQAEFRGSAPLTIVSNSRFRSKPAAP